MPRLVARSLIPLALVVAFVACGREPVSPAGGAGSVATYVPNYHKILPAFALPWERQIPGNKQDAAADFKAAHPSWYEETVAPAGTFRAMQEWEAMSALLITYQQGLYESNLQDSAGHTVVRIILNGYLNGKIIVLYDTVAAKTELTNLLTANGVPAGVIGPGEAIEFQQVALDAFWTIDWGPLPLVRDDNTVAFLDWRYYWERYLDDAVPSKLGEEWGTTVYRMPVNYEGGNFQADGFGTCYTT